MTNLEIHQLVHPELLTEDTLLQVLRDRCIEVPRLKSTSKTELVEIYKRVALPLPQRKYNDTTYLGRKLIDLGKCKGQREAMLSSMAPISSNVESSSKNNGSGSSQGGLIVDRLKPPFAVVGKESKENSLFKSAPIPSTLRDANKRKSEETLQGPPGCKRRKTITWP